jgi:hypothetical protein
MDWLLLLRRVTCGKDKMSLQEGLVAGSCDSIWLTNVCNSPLKLLGNRPNSPFITFANNPCMSSALKGGFSAAAS